MKRFLILISSAPDTPQALRALQLVKDLRRSGHTVSLALLQDSVLMTRQSPAPSHQALAELVTDGVQCYGDSEDLALRGLAQPYILPQVQLTNALELVDLMMEKNDSVLGIF